MSSFLNLGSLLFGLIAWIVPIIAFNYAGKEETKKVFGYSTVSFSACLVALCLQFFEIKHRVQIKDWTALMDTIGILIWVVVILVVATLILNSIVLCRGCKKATKIK